MIMDKSLKYSYNDIMVKPSILSFIESRTECSPYNSDGMLPLFTAPMDTVVSVKNFELFQKNGIIPILPRTVNLDTRLEYSTKNKWAAYSLDEFEQNFCQDSNPLVTDYGIRALIDTANGHMAKIYEYVRKSKRIYGDKIKVMVGNIANPETYRVCVESGVDYVRCSIGTGKGCTTGSNTGVGYPIASLISEIASIRDEFIGRGADKNRITKIVADGGIRRYRDIMKALACGADYVMIGSLFAKMYESAAPKTCDGKGWLSLPLSVTLDDIENPRLKYGKWCGDYEGKEIALGNIKAAFYGMASKKGQVAMRGDKVRTSEGIEWEFPVKYTMKTWVDNFKDFLTSAMSYTNSRTLDEYRRSEVITITQNAYNSIND